ATNPRESWRVLTTVGRHASRRTFLARMTAAFVGLAWARRRDVLDADLIHVHFGWVAATAAWSATRITGGRYSVVLHAFELHSARTADDFAGVPLRAADAVFTISDHDVALVRSRWGVDAAVLRMGVDRTWLAPPVPVEERESDLVVAVGSLVPK